MTSEEHYRQAEDLTDRTDVIGALPFEQLVEAQVHATLAVAASMQDIALDHQRDFPVTMRRQPGERLLPGAGDTDQDAEAYVRDTGVQAEEFEGHAEVTRAIS